VSQNKNLYQTGELSRPKSGSSGHKSSMMMVPVDLQDVISFYSHLTFTLHHFRDIKCQSL